ncbi:PKD1L2 [Mytilus coruscus]|uniref:PKD1L2 n=1 Tax=Mytilus coruscus TaxID=42192 RepID=A0A6J8DNV2_MYTCO|nr:PKD1L2 [Mytilus coruscus]
MELVIMPFYNLWLYVLFLPIEWSTWVNGTCYYAFLQFMVICYFYPPTEWSTWVNGTCSTICEQNRTRQCTSGTCTGDAWEVTSCDFGNCVIEGLRIGTSAEVLFRNDHSMTYSSFEWTGGPDISASVVIIDDNNITVPVTSDNVNNVGSFNITSSNINAKDFGVYHVQLKISNSKGIHHEDMALFYEEPIVLTSVNTPSEVLLNSTFEMTAILSSGSNVEFEWIMNDDDSSYILCRHIVRECTANYSYPTIGNFNITLVARNEVSYGILTDIFVTVLKEVAGFSLSHGIGAVNTTSSAKFIVILDSTDRQPMGNLTLVIDFGDGTSETSNLYDITNTMMTPGKTFSHLYSQQGEFFVTGNISSTVSSQSFSNITVNVWDDISQLSLDVAKFAHPSTDVNFRFQNYPPNGFEFSILYGDGDDLKSDWGVQYNAFDSTPWTHSYSSPGIYEITLLAINPEQTKDCKLNITIQYPITELIISPPAVPFLRYPTPDGIIEFEISQVSNAEPPTNVTCSFSFENNAVYKEKGVDIAYMQPFKMSYTYMKEGIKYVNVTCINVVSQFTVLTQVEIKTVTLNDFGFSYPTELNVNMSLNGDNELTDFSEDIQFNILLLNCTRFPLNVSLEFDFGDGTTPSDIIDFNVQHSFTKRGQFLVVVTISNSTSITTVNLPIKIGRIDFTVDKYIGSVGHRPFYFNISGPPSGGSYQLLTDDGNKYDLSSSSSPILKSHVYKQFGKYYPQVIATFPDFTEIVYLEGSLNTDYNLSVIMIDFNTTVDLPPGEITVIVSKHPLADDLPNVKCRFDFGDKIDVVPKEKTQDITTENPLVYHFTYFTLGYPIANFTCFNQYDRNENITTLTVVNECFPLTGIFDRQYSNTSNPLKLITSEDVDLSSRMPVKCADKDVGYKWKIYKIVNETEVLISYNPPEPPKGSLRFSRGGVSEGLYKVTLNVTLPETYVFEPTFVRFIKPPPFAHIDGGSQRQAALITPTVYIDALTHSYDLEQGYGGNDNLAFDWSCKGFAAVNSLANLSKEYENKLQSFSDCNKLLNTTFPRGKTVLKMMNASDQGYAVSVNVSVDNLITPFTQLILAVPGSPPIVSIVCQINCMAKYAVMVKSMWYVDCKDCTPNDVLSYQWEMYYKDLNGDWILISDLTEVSDIRPTSKSFAINDNKLQVERDYKLTVFVTGNGRDGVGEASSTFFTNSAPYGGYCKADPPIGNASTTSFQIMCFDWKDETENPMKYEFLMVERSNEDDGIEKETPFQFGGEMTATEIKFPVGDSNNNDTLYLRVKIYDVYGDYNVSDFTVISMPPAEYVPKDPNDVNATTKLFDDYDQTFAKVNKGGNTMALLRLMDSTASIYADIDLPTSGIPDLSTPMKCVNYTDSGSGHSSVRTNLQQKTDEMIREMDKRTPDAESNVGMTSADAGFMAKTLKTAIKNKALMNNKLSKQILKNIKKTIKNIIKRIEIKPLQMTEISSSKGTANEVVNVLTDILAYWKTGGSENLEEKLTVEDVEEEFREYYRKNLEQYHEEIADDTQFNTYVQKCYTNKQNIFEKQKAMSESTNGGAEDLFESADNALDTTAATTSPGEGEQLINKTDITLSVEKDSKDAFLNKSVVKRKGMSLQFNNDSLANVTDGTNMDLQVTVVDKSQLLHANGANQVRGQVMNIAVKDDEGNKINGNRYGTFGYKVFIKERVLKGGDIFIALKAMEDDQNVESPDIKVRRRRSSHPNDTFSSGYTNATDLATSNVSLAVVTTGCRVYDPTSSSWQSNGCSVLPFSTLNETVCRCDSSSGSIFSLAFAAPNMIDFSTVWSKFDPANAAVYATLIALLVLYFIFVVVLRRYDGTDTVRSIPTFLCDNQQSDEYFYMIAVHTGLRPGSGTKSNVCFILSGDTDDSGIRLLSDGERQGFETNSVAFFMMSTHKSIGDLSYLRIWHDNSGDGNTNSWYLHKIVVTDIHTDARYVFHCDKWLAMDMDDGLIDRIIPVIDNKECGFETAFSQQSRANVTENHLWLSLAIRPQKNSFTRVQRLSVILMLLFLTMITNAMFFQSSDDNAVTPDTVQIGSMRLSLKIVYVSFIGCVITVPPIVLVTYLFRNSSAKVKQKKKKQKNTDSMEDDDNDDDAIMTLTTKKKFPHWVVYIAWFVVALAVIASAFILLLYSMQWGKAKSEEWLTTFILSFIESILLVDPFKVIIVAILIAIIMKKPVEDEKLTVNLESVKRRAKKYQPSKNKQFIAFRLEVLARGGPPPAAVMEKERKLMMKQKEAKRAFVTLVLHIFFATVLFCMSYINRDQRGYLYKAHIDSQLFESSKYQYGFSKVSSSEAFFNWTKYTLIPLYYPTSEYNGDGISIVDKFFVGDMANLRLGLVRLRQVKVKKAQCYTRKLVAGHFCAKNYNDEREETGDLCNGCQTPLTTDAWKYVSSEKIWGIPIIGIYNTYGGGGYIQSFSNIKANTENILDELSNMQWIDRLTRAVFVEFALYNANINNICYSIFLAEFPETGGAFNWVDTQCFRPTLITSATGAFNLLLSIFFLIMVIGRMVTMIKGLKREKLKYLMNFWNILDILIVLLSMIGVGLWVTKFIFTKKALGLYAENKDVFINFQHIVVWEYAFNVLLGFLVFCSTIRVSSALGYNKRITEIAYVLKHGASEISGFGLQFFIIFSAFIIFGYLIFGIALHEFRNLFVSFGSLLNTIIGRNTLGKMQQAVPIFAEVYFFVYVFFVVFTLLTMFAAILNNSIIHVRSSNKNAQGEVGITDILKSTFRDMVGLVGIHIKGKGKNKSGYNYKGDSHGPVSSAKVVSFVRETFADAFDEDTLVFQKKEKGKLKHLNDLIIQKSAVNDYDRSNTCTPRQVRMDFYR